MIFYMSWRLSFPRLEKHGTCIRLMCDNFSSAFNTIQPHLLACKLMKVNVDTILWILEYLTNCPQFVRLASGLTVDLVYISIGGPLGTCLSQFLCTLYTAGCWSAHEESQTDKFTDDTAQIGQVTDKMTDTTCKLSLILFSGVTIIFWN